MVASPAGLEERLGYRFGDPSLLVHALRHRSWCSEHPGHESNERLEFLGDAVLGWVVADVVYRRHAASREGRLTDLRKSVVNALALADVARSLEVGPCLLLGRGEAAADGGEKSSILSDAMEAIIGAVYLDGGTQAAHDLVVRLLGELLDLVGDVSPYTDFKTMLQETSARLFEMAPVYVLTEEGPDHAKHFSASAFVNGAELGRGEGTTKKQAEQLAAREAIASLGSRTAPAARNA
jgi:ribonuclease-3